MNLGLRPTHIVGRVGAKHSPPLLDKIVISETIFEVIGSGRMWFLQIWLTTLGTYEVDKNTLWTIAMLLMALWRSRLCISKVLEWFLIFWRNLFFKFSDTFGHFSIRFLNVSKHALTSWYALNMTYSALNNIFIRFWDDSVTFCRKSFLNFFWRFSWLFSSDFQTSPGLVRVLI